MLDTDAAAKAKAEAAHQRAVAGEDFAELAKELSEGPSGPNGGDLGFFEKQRMAPAFADAAFALEPGEISPVIKTQFGYHVIKVEERRGAGDHAPLKRLDERIRQNARQPEGRRRPQRHLHRDAWREGRSSRSTTRTGTGSRRPRPRPHRDR